VNVLFAGPADVDAPYVRYDVLVALRATDQFAPYGVNVPSVGEGDPPAVRTKLLEEALVAVNVLFVALFAPFP
jgi:hypothetical protein